MESSDARLLRLLDEHVGDVHPGWQISGEPTRFRVQSPVEPCELCGQRVYLILVNGQEHPTWVTLGAIKGEDTLFPCCSQRLHKCGDGESWSVEAAVFMEAAMADWARVDGAP